MDDVSVMTKIIFFALSGFSSLSAALALLIIKWIWERMSHLDERLNLMAATIATAVDEPKVRVIVSEDVKELKEEMHRNFDRFTQVQSESFKKTDIAHQQIISKLTENAELQQKILITLAANGIRLEQ
tara:strand:+ start:160 stop:543 length:384 start_codon:yes stop_codon:yes gene_type:complete